MQPPTRYERAVCARTSRSELGGRPVIRRQAAQALLVRTQPATHAVMMGSMRRVRRVCAAGPRAGAGGVSGRGCTRRGAGLAPRLAAHFGAGGVGLLLRESSRIESASSLRGRTADIPGVGRGVMLHPRDGGADSRIDDSIHAGEASSSVSALLSIMSSSPHTGNCWLRIWSTAGCSVHRCSGAGREPGALVARCQHRSLSFISTVRRSSFVCCFSACSASALLVADLFASFSCRLGGPSAAFVAVRSRCLLAPVNLPALLHRLRIPAPGRTSILP